MKPNLALSALLLIGLGLPKFAAASLVGVPQASGPMAQLAWDVDHKKLAPKMGDMSAHTAFTVTNISDAEVVIDHVKASCLCTVAKLPSQPWHLPAHSTGKLEVTVDLRDKVGEFEKTLNVYFSDSNAPPQALWVSVKMPDTKMMRDQNMTLAKRDRQAVFRGDCAKCHAEPAKTAAGMELYHEICGVCHEAKPRATMVPDLRLITNHPTDAAFWKMMIANGKPGTLMPAFSTNFGGPLSDEQIDAMAKMIDAAFPYARFLTPPSEK